MNDEGALIIIQEDELLLAKKVVEPVKNGVKRKLPMIEPKKRGKKKRGSSANSKTNTVLPEEYEVERIVAHSKTGDKIDYYKVKWKGWDEAHDTWEPVDNLRSSLAMIADYHQNRIYPGRGEVVYKSHVDTLRIQLSELNEGLISDLCVQYLTNYGHTVDVNEDEVEEKLSVLCRIPPFARDAKMIDEVRRPLQLLEFKRRRERQMELLKAWEGDMNSISTDPAKLQVYNGVDLDGVPTNFHYINNYVTDCDVEIPDNNPLACSCEGHCLKKTCCWNTQWSEAPYTKDGILRFAKGCPIFECNKNCKCGPNCGNRILQKGRTVPVAIFKTANGCGWGVRTLVDIKKGQFVVEYVGEVIKFDTAEHRGKTYDKVGCTYLFDLDFNDNVECPYTVDAAVYGNTSHFINHSCEPNLHVFAVWVDSMDMDLPRLGLYACRNIKAFEELSFDYMIEKKTPKKKKDLEKQTTCRCNSKNCRKLVF
uniref:Histone-lysine N-methyltransferase n=2 Tax=Lygus hesperus TaxID=30085 RepID=A0A146LEB6_LYGHE